MNVIWTTLAATTIAAMVLAPLLYLPPRAKKNYLPIAMGLPSAGLAYLALYSFVNSPILCLSGSICYGLAIAGFIRLKTTVCMECGHIDGLTNEVHVCTNLKTYTPQKECLPTTNREVHCSWIESKCASVSHLNYDSSVGILKIADCMKKTKRFLGVFGLALGILTLTLIYNQDGEIPGYTWIIFAIPCFAAISLTQTTEAEIDVRHRIITKSYRCFGMLVAWRQNYSVVEGDKLRFYVRGSDGNFYHDIACSNGSTKKITLSRYLLKTKDVDSKAMQTIEILAGALQVAYEAN